MTDLSFVTRRSLLQQAMMAAGVVALGGFSEAALGAAAKGAKRTLDAPQFAALKALADTLLPRTDTAGAIDANVPALADAMIGQWASAAHRDAMLGALAALDKHAREKAGKVFAALAPEPRAELLTAFEAEALRILPGARADRQLSLIAAPNYADPGYGRIRELVVALYYYSEPALTQELNYVHVPGKWQPSVPVTPETRPSGAPHI